MLTGFEKKRGNLHGNMIRISRELEWRIRHITRKGGEDGEKATEVAAMMRIY